MSLEDRGDNLLKMAENMVNKLPVDLDFPFNYFGDDITDKAVCICQRFLPGVWKKITSSDVQVSRISGGLSNWLFHVKLEKSEIEDGCGEFPKEIMLRLYGQSHGQCDSQHAITECVIFALLAERNLGPKLHGIFPGGRLEEYVPARSLTLEEMHVPQISTLIGQKMAAIHSLELPLSRDPTWIWDTTTRWLNEIGDTRKLDHNNADLKELLKKDLNNELQWLKTHITRMKIPVTFCHNDLQEGNILLRHGVVGNGGQVTSENCQHLNVFDLVIIDYEYCAYNYRSYDIANHFIEWIYDYKVDEYPYFKVYRDRYPSKANREEFVRHYLEASDSKDNVEDILKEVEHLTLASHLLWGVWSLVNGKSSKILFGYWEYAAERLQMYYKLKSSLVD